MIQRGMARRSDFANAKNDGALAFGQRRLGVDSPVDTNVYRAIESSARVEAHGKLVLKDFSRPVETFAFRC
jgi:hypothetical protein